MGTSWIPDIDQWSAYSVSAGRWKIEEASRWHHLLSCCCWYHRHLQQPNNTSCWPAGGRSSFTNTSDLIGEVLRYSTATVHPCQHLIKYSSISSRGFLKKSAGVIGKTVGVCVSFYDDTGRGTWTRHADHDLTNHRINIYSTAGRRILTPNCKSMRERRTWSGYHDQYALVLAVTNVSLLC